MPSLIQEASEPIFLIGDINQRNKVGNNTFGKTFTIHGTLNVCYLSSDEERAQLGHDVRVIKILLDYANNEDIEEDVQTPIEDALRVFIGRWSRELIPPMLRHMYYNAAYLNGFETTVPIDLECITGTWGTLAEPTRRPEDHAEWVRADLHSDTVTDILEHTVRPFAQSLH